MNEKRKKLIYLILGVMIVAFACIGGYYWYQNTYYVSTEDASIQGDLVTVGPQISGKLMELDVEEGDTVVKGQIIGRQGISNPQNTNIDQTVLRAPINGIVIKKQGTVGEIISPGQTVAMIVDPSKLYVTANIEETKLGNVKQGRKWTSPSTNLAVKCSQAKLNMSGRPQIQPLLCSRLRRVLPLLKSFKGYL
jgi:multidrug resistance efflux pump